VGELGPHIAGGRGEVPRIAAKLPNHLRSNPQKREGKKPSLFRAQKSKIKNPNS
jgi:hypothetical protein